MCKLHGFCVNGSVEKCRENRNIDYFMNVKQPNLTSPNLRHIQPIWHCVIKFPRIVRYLLQDLPLGAFQWPRLPIHFHPFKIAISNWKLLFQIRIEIANSNELSEKYPFSFLFLVTIYCYCIYLSFVAMVCNCFGRRVEYYYYYYYIVIIIMFYMIRDRDTCRATSLFI